MAYHCKVMANMKQTTGKKLIQYLKHTLSSQLEPDEKALLQTDTSFSTSTPFFRFWTFIAGQNILIYSSNFNEKLRLFDNDRQKVCNDDGGFDMLWFDVM